MYGIYNIRNIYIYIILIKKVPLLIYYINVLYKLNTQEYLITIMLFK